MLGRFGPREAAADRVVVAVLGIAFVGVGLLLVQTALALRSHERVTQTALDDFAAFGADRITDALDATFSALFLDRIAVARAAHEGWAREGVPAPVPGYPHLSAAAFPLYFTLDGSTVTANRGSLDEATRALIVATVVPHARDVYPRPAPYAVLRGSDPKTIVYRKEQYAGEDRIFGFVVQLDELDVVYARLLNGVPVLPRSVAAEDDVTGLAGVRLYLPQGDRTLFERKGPDARTTVSATSFAGKAGRMAATVTLDGDALRARVPGAREAPSPALLAALALLTLGLLGAAVALTRRAARLHDLREAFVANVSHDLRTPLAQIRMFSESLMLDRLPAPEDRRVAIEVIHNQAGHLGEMVENVLAAAAGLDRPSVRSETRIDTILDETIEALSPTIRTRGVDVVRRREGPDTALVDPATLRRVATNLLDNALKFGPHGQTVTVSVENRADHLELSVADGGPGVPRRHRKRVWERFARLHERHPATGGSGLGLAVVRELAHRHGGVVSIDEAPGGGARVRVTLATTGPA